MIVLSLALVIAAAVALFIGLFVTTGLEFIYIAIGLCLLSLLLLWLGTRSRKGDAPTAPSPPVYGGVRAGTTAAPAARSATVARDERSDEVDELDELTAPSGGEVVRATTARDRAAARVADAAPDASDGEEEPTTTGDGDASSVQVVSPTASRAMASTHEEQTPKKSTTKKAATKKSGTRKAATKKAATKKAATKKAATKKSATKKSATKKAATKKSATKKSATKKSATKKSAAKKAATSRGTRGAAARQRLSEIPGVGPAKQEALLSRYGSLEAIRDAPVDDIVDNVRGFGQALATRVKDAL